jgi:tight adherence protein C
MMQIWDAPTAFLVSFGTTMLAVAGLFLLAYRASEARTRLRHRVEFLAFGRPPSTRLRADAAARSRAVPIRLVTAGLRGADLELARRLASLPIAPALMPRLLVAMRLTTGLVLAIALPSFAYLYLSLGTLPNLIGLGALGAAFGWAMPHIVIERLSQHRQRAIARGLADAIELLVISVEAGLSLEEAINRIVDELQLSQPAMAAELALTSADLKILPSRDDALRRLAERVKLSSVRSVVTTLSQTLKYGTPLAQALRIVAADLRNSDLLRLEEQTNRLPVLLTIPMILFILPSIFLIIGGPALLRVLDTMLRMH